jgi:ribonuclease R
MNPRRTAILDLVNLPGYRPAKPRVIAKNIGDDDAEAVRKEIKRLVKEGLLAFGQKHLVERGQGSGVGGQEDGGPETVRGMAAHEVHESEEDRATDSSAPNPEPQTPKTKKAKRDHEHVVGTFRRADGGFGFVRPEGTRAGEGRDADIFVPAKHAGDAASGDVVRIKLGKLGRLGKPEGRVIDVVERATNRFVGVYFEQAGMGLVQVDGKVFANPIYVGDPGAKGVAADDKVVLEMVRFPSQVRDGEGVIVEVLGPRGQPGVDTMSIIHEFGLPGPFAADALEEARRQAELFDESIGSEASGGGAAGGQRRDLTGETIITIDPVTARDFDDAISLERLDNGHWLLGVHIADVSHFVQPKTPLDREAHQRATSVYLPDRVIPMLPEVISNNLASLQPDRVRYAITARLEFAPDGVRTGCDVFKSAIKSRRRFAYEEVDAWLTEKGLVEARPQSGAGPSGSAGEAGTALRPEVDALLGRMFELAMILRGRRFRRGALELSMPEIEIDLDRDGRVVGAHLEQNTESHQIIEEFMLAANEAVAEKLRDADVLFLRRVHGSPDPRKLKALTAFVEELGFKTESLESRFALQRLLDEVKGDPRQHAVNHASLRSMQRAVYSPEDDGHFALSSDCYCHFTSPIRRYPDLTVHRLFEQLARGEKPTGDMQSLLILGDHCSEREQRAAEAERELNKLKLLNYLADKIGMAMDGVVTGVESYGLFVTGSQLPAEGFVSSSGLTDDYYRYDRAGHVLHGLRSGNSYRLGDAVRVAVAAVDVDRRELDFRLLGRLGKSAGPAAGKRRLPSRGSAKRGKGKSAGRKKGGKKKRKR